MLHRKALKLKRAGLCSALFVMPICMVLFLYLTEFITKKVEHRYAQPYNYQSWPGVFGFIDKQNYADSRCQYNVHGRQHRITECLIWSWQVRAFNTQHKHANNCKDVKEHYRKYHIIEQVAIGA